MGMRIQLRDVTEHNWEEVVELEVFDDQDDFLPSNAYSLAESKYDPHAIPKAIYNGKKLIGFLMYESLAYCGERGSYSLYRFMIDRKHQRKGYGRAAVQALVDLIRKQDRSVRRITVCYEPENIGSKTMFGKFGFKEIGLDEDNEMIAEWFYDQT